MLGMTGVVTTSFLPKDAVARLPLLPEPKSQGSFPTVTDGLQQVFTSSLS